jgi:hypothetical protein
VLPAWLRFELVEKSHGRGPWLRKRRAVRARLRTIDLCEPSRLFDSSTYSDVTREDGLEHLRQKSECLNLKSKRTVRVPGLLDEFLEAADQHVELIDHRLDG